MKLYNYKEQVESLQELQKDFPEYYEEHKSIEKTFEGFSEDKHMVRQIDFPEDNVYLDFAVMSEVKGSDVSFSLTIMGNLFSSKDPKLSQLENVQSTWLITNENDIVKIVSYDNNSDSEDYLGQSYLGTMLEKIVKSKPKQVDILGQIVVEHLDTVLLRAAELNNHAHEQMVYVKSLSPLDALTLLQYRYQGDELVNEYLRNTLTTEAAIKILTRQIKQNEGYPFPMQSQAVQLDFDQESQLSLLVESEERMHTRHLLTKMRNNLRTRLEEMLKLFAYDLQRILGGAPRGLRLTVYRGVKVARESRVKKDPKTVDFVSTSTDQNIALEFMTVCCLLTYEIPETQPILHFSKSITKILIQKVQEAQPEYKQSFFDELYSERLDEDEVLLLSSTPIKWKGLTATIQGGPSDVAVRSTPLTG